MKTKTSTQKGMMFIFLASIAWSFSGVLGKWVPFGPLTIMGGRALMTTLFFALQRKSFRFVNNRGTWLGAVSIAATSLLFLIANKLTTSANAIVLQYAMPAVVILLSWVLYRQKPSRLDVLAALFVMVGVVLCFVSGLGGGTLIGDLIALLSAVSFALVYMAARMPRTDPMDYTYQGNLLSCLCLLTVPFDSAFSFNPSALFGVFLMGLALTFGYFFFSLGMKSDLNPVTASILSNLEPVLNPTWVFLAMGEKPGLYSIIGAFVVLGTVTVYGILKNRKPAQA